MVFLASVCALLWSHSATVQQSPVTLQFSPPIGAVYRYQMSMSMSANPGAGSPPIDMQTDTELDMKVISRTANITKIQSRMDNTKITLPPDSPIASKKEATERSLSGKVIETSYDSLHRLQRIDGTGTGADGMIGNFQNLSFPDHAIKIGDSWTDKMDIEKMLAASMGNSVPGMKVDGTIPIKFLLQNVSQVDGKALADIQVVMKGDASISANGQSMNVHFDGSGNQVIEIATGMIFSTKIVSVNVMSVGGRHVVLNMTVSLTRR